MAEKETDLLDEGKWIVHRRHGVGQIVGVQTMGISGEPQEYYKVETVDRMVWIPVDDLDMEAYRPVTQETDFQEIINILKSPSHKMKGNFKSRQKRIRDVRKDNALSEIAELVRDLRGRQVRRKGLNQTETRALERMTRRLVAEWSVSMGVDLDEARARLNEILNESAYLDPVKA